MGRLPALREYLEEHFDGRFTVDQTLPTITTVQTEILPSNYERMAVMIINQGTGVVFINIGPFKNLTSGIQLAGNGGACFYNAHDDLVLPGIEVFAWSASGGATLSVFSIYRYRGSE